MKRLASTICVFLAATLLCHIMPIIPLVDSGREVRADPVEGNPDSGTDESDSESVEINEENFPDEIFRNYVSENFDNDGNGELKEEEIEAVTNITVSGMGITDLTGVEYFIELRYLYCVNNELTSLDVSACTNLMKLSPDHNRLSFLDVSGCTNLKYLYCNHNNLTILDVSNCRDLIFLACYANNLTKIDICNNSCLISAYNGSRNVGSDNGYSYYC